MSRNNITTEQQKQILELRATGLSYLKISKETGVGKQTCVDICKTYEEQISTLHAMELEGLYEEAKITKEERIKAHAELLKRIKAELEGRDLSEVPTDKLIDLYLKTDTILKEEMIEPKFLSTEDQNRERAERDILDKLTSFS